MQFLKILFWIAVTLIVVLFATANKQMVTINLWGGLQADVRLYGLVIAAFLLGFLPMLVLHRARLWSLRRRLEPAERSVAAPPVVTAPAPQPVPVTNGEAPQEERLATDSKVWPAS